MSEGKKGKGCEGVRVRGTWMGREIERERVEG